MLPSRPRPLPVASSSSLPLPRCSGARHVAPLRGSLLVAEDVTQDSVPVLHGVGVPSDCTSSRYFWCPPLPSAPSSPSSPEGFEALRWSPAAEQGFDRVHGDPSIIGLP